MKKVVFTDQSLDGGGAEKVLCTVLRGMNPDEFDIHLVLVSRIGDLKHLVPKYVTIHELGIKNTSKALIPFVKLMHELKPDSVFSTLTRTTILTVLGRLLSGRYTLISRYPNMPSKQVEDGKLKGWRGWLTKILYRHVDKVIAQTEEMGAELVQHLSIPENKITAIRNPVDTEHIFNSLEGQSSPFNEDNINLVASGRIVAQKGFDILIESMSVVIGQDNNVHLYILGRDNEDKQAELINRAKALGVSGNIHFQGFQINPYPYYKFCDLFVLSSRYEGLPNVLLECQCLGKKVAATRCIPIVDRLVIDGVNGFKAVVGDPKSLANSILKALELEAAPKSCSNNSVEEIIDLLR